MVCKKLVKRKKKMGRLPRLHDECKKELARRRYHKRAKAKKKKKVKKVAKKKKVVKTEKMFPARLKVKILKFNTLVVRDCLTKNGVTIQ